MDPVVTTPGTGRKISYGGDRIEVLYESEGLAVARFTVPPGFAGPHPHRHLDVDEGFYVLSGTLTLLIGEEEVDAPAGTFAMATRGTRHSFSNKGDKQVEVLGYWVPGKGLGLLEDIGPLIGGGEPPDPAAMAEVYRKHNSELV